MLDTEQTLYLIKATAQKLNTGVRNGSITSIGPKEVTEAILSFNDCTIDDLTEIASCTYLILKELVHLFHADNPTGECSKCCAKHICGKTKEDKFVISEN